jgi:hypothetical protein
MHVLFSMLIISAMRFHSTALLMGVFTLVTFWPSCQTKCQADEWSPPRKNIDYLARIPQSIARRRPAATLTRFYGLTNISGQKLALHFYESKKAKVIDEYSEQHDGWLEVFTVSEKTRRKSYKPLHKIALSRQGWPDMKLTVQMQSLWLDTKAKTKPIILLRVTNSSEGSAGYDSNDTLITFARGLKSKPAINSFTAGRPDEGLQDWGTAYGPPDEKGHMTIVHINNAPDGASYEAYKWNGSTFESFASASYMHEKTLRYHWNGKKFID